MMTSTIEHQARLEELSLTEGRNRYLKSLSRTEEDQGFSSRSDIEKLIKGAIPSVSKVIFKTLESFDNQGSGRTAVFVSYLNELDPDLLALIGLQAVFNGIGSERPLTTVCNVAGKAVETELWALQLERKDKALLKRLVKRATETHGSVAYRKKAIKATAAKEGHKVEEWPQELRVKVGSPLISAVLQGCADVFDLIEERSHGKTTKFIALTPAASEYIASVNEVEGWMHPIFKPMVVPPRPWRSVNTGCYISEKLSRGVSLIRTFDREHRNLVQAAIKAGNMQLCLQAVNAIQATAWKINSKVLEVVQWAHEQDLEIDSFPKHNHISRPPRPENWDNLPTNEKKAWRIKVSQVAKRNRGIDGENVVFRQDIATAEELKGHEAFWLPCSLDFRGRVYSVPHFNNQRADHIKALFTFADGLPLGTDGAEWLAIHLANCGDFGKVSKRSLDERSKWTRDNHEMIQKIAADFKTTTDIWMKADKPFQFLAAVFEYAEYLNEGVTYVSHLPIALDGSNSGLQHYSAALRSTEGALVNLVPTDKPSDVYQAVCDKTVEILTKQSEAQDNLSTLILKNGVTRSLVKRNVMTFAYSSEQYGFAEQHRADLMAPLTLKVLEGKLPSHPYGVPNEDGSTDEGFKASMVLAKAVWTAVNEIVKDASEGMKFFQKCAGALAHERKPLMWVTPLGLPVLHKYVEWDVKKVRLFMFDKSISVDKAANEDLVTEEGVLNLVKSSVRTKPNGHINKDRAKSAVAPNVIHSLDACHLMMTINAAWEKGMNNFSLIHDSFGTHAANTTEFFYTIREQFVDMYENFCPFEEVEYHTRKHLKEQEKVPALPQKGQLDLAGVIDSLYAFA
jgi:DNA-directed RNA polymerase